MLSKRRCIGSGGVLLGRLSLQRTRWIWAGGWIPIWILVWTLTGIPGSVCDQGAGTGTREDGLEVPVTDSDVPS